MEGEEGRNQGAAPDRAGHLVKKQEEQQRVGEVQEKAGEMVAGRLQAIELGIQLMREPRQRMPVGALARAEGPRRAPPGEPRLNIVVVRHVLRVVIVHKPASRYGPVGRQRRSAQQQTEQELLPGKRDFHCG